MPIDWELQPILADLSGGPALDQVPLELLRQGSPIPREQAVPVARVENRTLHTPLGELPVRIYQPRVAGAMPVLVYFHGGGFVLGNLDTHDSLARSLSVGADCMVVSVDYRLAPEHRFPAAIDDCLAAVRWIQGHAAEIGADPTRIAVGGDSAGGNLATVVALRLRDEGGAAPVGQLLVYPMTWLRAPVEGSMVVNGEGYFLTASAVAWFENMYLAEPEQASHPHASPLLAKSLGGLPPALVITAEFDPLLDQGEAYAKRLSESGVAVTHSHYLGAIHGFFGMPAAIGRRAVAQAVHWLKQVFRKDQLPSSSSAR